MNLIELNEIKDDALITEVLRVINLSPFFEDLLEQVHDFVSIIGSCDECFSKSELHARYKIFVSGCDQDFPSALRLLRKREMVRIIFRDLTRRATLIETTGELSCLADFCIQAGLYNCYQTAIGLYGQPLSPSGEPQQMIVLGMGKLGAHELNLSSDVDLIFFYSHQGTLNFKKNGNEQIISFHEFFIRLARELISYLDDTTSIDKVFRVDMRLRPYGDSGPIVLHRAAMEKYYIEQGRDWERYAFIKARVVAGNIEEGQDFLNWLKPFVFRRHQDFGAIQSLREMKGLIARQVEINKITDDLKLGSGGIREIEFIAQAHQLIWGGRYPELQKSGLTEILNSLADAGFLASWEASSLIEAYFFLRNSEHVIQAEFDKQTHLLPSTQVSRKRLAEAMGYEDYDEYLIALNDYRTIVSRSFGNLVSSKEGTSNKKIKEEWVKEWQAPTGQILCEFKVDIEKQRLAQNVEASLDDLMPSLLSLIAESSNPDVAINRILPLVRAILRRSTYLVFLRENPDALIKLVELVTLSPWIASQIEAYPILLYELTEKSLRELAVTKLELEGKLRELMRILDAHDLENQMDMLRQFKLATMLKIAAMELSNELSVMQASDSLTALAEVILGTSVDIARNYLEGRHGRPTDTLGNPVHSRLAIVAYGKGGGFELAYGSDLDLVFLCSNENKGSTDGKSLINNNVFYVRFCQRVIHILTSFTRFGILYSTDLRLRPQGNKGPLVATVEAFERYQRYEAWTWEHQALVRARFFAGDASLGQAFKTLRREVIEKKRSSHQLLQDVSSMRRRMQDHHKSASFRYIEDEDEALEEFDLKHDSGAIVDIEFMVQYEVLAGASVRGQLVRWTDVIRLLDELESLEIMTANEVEILQSAYLAFRAAVHHGWLGLSNDFQRLQKYRFEVRRIWRNRMEGGEH